MSERIEMTSERYAALIKAAGVTPEEANDVLVVAVADGPSIFADENGKQVLLINSHEAEQFSAWWPEIEEMLNEGDG